MYNMYNVIRGCYRQFLHLKGCYSWDILPGMNLALGTRIGCGTGRGKIWWGVFIPRC